MTVISGKGLRLAKPGLGLSAVDAQVLRVIHGFIRSPGEARALWALRRALCGAWQCGSNRVGADLAALASAFADATRLMTRCQAHGLSIACNGSLTMTRDEARLLRAIAAAQAGDEGLVDTVLFRLTPAAEPRAALAAAVTLLAAVLAASGYWLGEAEEPPASLARRRPGVVGEIRP